MNAKFQGEAAAAIAQMTSTRGTQTQPVPLSVQQMAVERQLYIFNVAPWSYQQFMGTMGAWFIPARLDGERYSRPCIVPGVIPEDVHIGPMGDGHYEKRFHDGLPLAMDIMGVGMHQAPENALTQCGVFLAEGPNPTEAELQDAEAKLKAFLEKTLAEADGEYSINHGIRVITDRNGAQKTVSALLPQHYRAAQLLGVTRPWIAHVNAAVPAEMLICPDCGMANRPNAIRCKESECRYIFDEERARQRFPEMFAHEQAERRGPGRPRNAVSE